MEKTSAETIRDEPSTSLGDLGELYHDYKIFGATNRQLPGIFSPNQRCKEPIIIAYIQYAIAKARQKMDDEVRFAELFCADGYYAMVARRLGADRSLGIDNDRDGYLGKAAAIAARLRLSNVHFLMAKKFLILQTVYSMADGRDDYFETPAPGWTWGCRFSANWLEKQITALGYEIVDRHRNELEGNVRPEDRGSAYYLFRRSSNSSG